MNYEDLYILFIRLKAENEGRGYRLPKNMEEHFKTKFSKQNMDALMTASVFFRTKWQNIDPEMYLKCGFEMFKKSFTYQKFLDPRIMQLYIVKDKNLKREVNINKKELVESLKFIAEFMRDQNRSSRFTLLENYCKVTEGKIHVAVQHYLTNKISTILVVYFISKKYIILSNEEKALIPYIEERYRELKPKMEEVKDFIEKAEDLL